MKRENHLKKIHQLFKTHPIVAILGPRQCGKTTLSKLFVDQNSNTNVSIFDLEDPMSLARLATPKLALEALEGLIIIDEIQRQPELFPIIRVIVDQDPTKKFLILGSASRELIKQSSESLAGRIAYLELTPFNLNEIDDNQKLWQRGGFPKSYLAQSDEDSFIWRREYVRTYLEQDIPNLGFNIPAPTLYRFWMMLTHYHGNLLNYSEIGKSMGLSDTSIRKYVDILSGTFMIRVLNPWHENIQKRQIKTPKIYFRDSGIFHYLCDITSPQQLITHPKLGASWEGFAVEEVIRHSGAHPNECYFWGIHNQAELDLILFKNGKRIGFEIKYTDSPSATKSIKNAITQLALNECYIICPGNHTFNLDSHIKVVGIETLSTLNF
jgi:predicted AAA+ superfamily ATPase